MTYNVLKKPDVFYIGKQDENSAETIDIDYSAWIEKYGEGVITATFQGAEDENPYDIVLTTADGIATWTVTDANTVAAGVGKLQLNYVVDEVVAKSLIWTVRVYPSMRASGEAPDGYQDWLTALQDLSAETQQNAQDAAQSASEAEEYAEQAKASADSITGLTVEAETLPAGSSATASFDADTDKLSFGVPRGDKGEKGDAGQDGVTPDLTIGTTETLPAGSSATATITGTAENPVLNLGIPQGVQGVQGERGVKGDTGATPDISIGTVETLNPDESATATITGTAENPVLNFGIPKGDTGEDGFSPSASVTKQGGNIIITITDKDGTTSETLEVDDALDDTSENPVQNQAIQNALWNLLPVDTASGAIASFPDGADDVPVKSLIVQIEPIQEGNGDPSPDNVRPISGHTGATVEKRGKNLVETVAVSRTAAGITFTTNADGTVHVVGTSTGTAWWKGSTTHADWRFLKAGTYILTGGISLTKILYIVGQMVDGTPINNTTIGNVYDRGSGLTFTLPKDSWLNYQIQISSGQTVDETFYPMIRLASDTATAYEPYKGETIPVSWETEAGTVYGGTLDVVSGKLTVDRAMVDLGTLNYGYNTTYKAFSAYKGDIKARGMCISSQYKYGDGVSAPDMTCCLGYAGWFVNNIVIKDSRYTDATVFKAAMSGVQLVYELAEPIEYTLTPQEVRTLLGQNNIWADTGDTEVIYRADIQKYIEKRVTS